MEISTNDTYLEVPARWGLGDDLEVLFRVLVSLGDHLEGGMQL